MKILLCHNFYQQPGGEDGCYAQETDLLEAHGHKVLHYTRHNDDVHGMSSWAVARQTLWSKRSYREVSELLDLQRPDVIHCTNTFPLISPAVYAAANDAGVPVVQGLHNYRLLCPSATFLRDGKVCESCLGKTFALPAIRHACYRESRTATSVVALMLATQRLRKTWERRIDLFYALTEFARDKFIEGGLPADKLRVKPNFVAPDPGFADGNGGYAVFVGRLSPEKGIPTLLEAWSKLKEPIPLKIVGDGPLADLVRDAATRDSRIDYVGRKSSDDVLQLVGDAACMLLPSLCYEGFPRTIVESFSRGTPVIASRLGSMTELIQQGRTGRLVTPGDPSDLAINVQAYFHDNEQYDDMRRAVRHEFMTKYSAEQNYDILIDIYQQAMAQGRQPAMASARESLPRDSETPTVASTASNCKSPFESWNIHIT